MKAIGVCVFVIENPEKNMPHNRPRRNGTDLAFYNKNQVECKS